MFEISGGEFGPAFGDKTIFKVNYQANKDEIHKFLNFLLDAKTSEYSDDDDMY